MSPILVTELLNKSIEESKKEVSSIVVDPMYIKSVSGDIAGRIYEVLDGVCGFAYVNVKGLRGNTKKVFQSFGFRVDEYRGGLTLSISLYNQSLAKKEAYANVFADKLRASGFDAYAFSVID